MKYARRRITWAEFFLAEDYFGVFSSGEEYDLLNMEDRMADYADCLLLSMSTKPLRLQLRSRPHSHW